MVTAEMVRPTKKINAWAGAFSYRASSLGPKRSRRTASNELDSWCIETGPTMPVSHVDAPTLFVHRAVVPPTQGDQVGEVGLPARPRRGSKLQPAAGSLLREATIVTRSSWASGAR
jgi:hypothetical protein